MTLLIVTASNFREGAWLPIFLISLLAFMLRDVLFHLRR